MWPGASPAWRKRQPNTKPRLGINRNPKDTNFDPYLASTSTSVDLIFPTVDPLIFVKRQLDDDAGLDEAGDAAPTPAVTYNNGLWTPPAATSIAALTPPAFTATIVLASSSDSEDAQTTSVPASSTLPSTTPTQTSSTKHTSSHASSSTLSPSSSTSSASPSSTALPNKAGGGGSGGFKLVYLTPIFVFVGLLLLFSVGGRIWGRIHHASRLEASKRARYDARASRQAKKREMQAIKTMWGYDRTPVLPDELEPGQHDIHYSDPSKTKSGKGSKVSGDGDSSFGSDSESGVGEKEDERYPGTFKILSLALLGEGSKPEPPQTREGGRKYETGVQSNSWLAVKIKRWVGVDPQNTQEGDEKYTVGPNKQGTRRLKHALSRERIRGSAGHWNEKDRSSPSSPATTLSVGSGEMKYKSEFEAVDLDPPLSSPTRSLGRYTSLSRAVAEEDDDPFLTKQPSLGWRKPLPPQPKESPFRPAILNFGLRSRSKTYDAVSPHPQNDTTPAKPNRFYTTPNPNEPPAGFFGLGISGVWKAVTNFTTSQAHQQVQGEEDEESFVARPYRPYSEVMSESDTPYSARHQPREYVEAGTPTKSQQLNRTGTVLNVKSTNQPWSQSERKMTTAAFNEALLASPPNKHQQQLFQPMLQQSPSPSPTKQKPQQALAPRKSLLLQQVIAANNGGSGEGNGESPAFTDYSDLVACYSTPSDAMLSPETFGVAGEEVVASIRALPSTAAAEGDGARAKLQRAKTTKLPPPQVGAQGTVQRSKTSSTSTTNSTEPTSRLGPGLSRKGTMHHSVLKKTHAHEPSEEHTSSPTKNLYPYTLTQPLRVHKPPEVAIPQRGSSSPTKPPSSFPPTTAAALPSSLRIASPEPLTNPYIHHQGFASFPHPHHHPHYPPEASPPKRAKAVSNRSNGEEDHTETGARTVVQKAKNRSTALQTVDHIVSQSYAQHHQHFSS